MSTVVPFAERPEGKTICLFDVDGTLSAARLSASQEMLDLLKQVRAKAVIGFVGGSDLPKITEQLAIHGQDITEDFDYCFAENGLTAIKLGKTLSSESFIGFIGEEKYQKLVSFILHYIADLVIPVKRGTFVEFRNGMVNVSPIGRNASQSERMAFEAYDKIHKIRATMIEAIKAKFPDYGLTYSIGGQLSFDMFPTGWDKTFALNHIKDEGFTAIHFFGDKTYKGGNDYEIYEDPRTIGHAVTCPEDTMAELRKMFNL